MKYEILSRKSYISPRGRQAKGTEAQAYVTVNNKGYISLNKSAAIALGMTPRGSKFDIGFAKKKNNRSGGVDYYIMSDGDWNARSTNGKGSISGLHIVCKALADDLYAAVGKTMDKDKKIILNMDKSVDVKGVKSFRLRMNK